MNFIKCCFENIFLGKLHLLLGFCVHFSRNPTAYELSENESTLRIIREEYF